MKKLLSIMLAVLLVASFGITMFPTQSVEASHDHMQGIVYHIKAKGQGTCDYYPPYTYDVNGEFFINLSGSADFLKWGWGWGSWANDGRGHVKGSFGDHEIDAVLEVTWIDYNYLFRWEYPNHPMTLHFKAKGFYDGEKAIAGWGHLGPIKPGATEMKLVLSLTDKNNIQHVTTIYMDDSADIFKADIDLVGR